MPKTRRLAGELQPPDLRSLDAIHLATAQLLGQDFGRVVTYDERMAEAARFLRMRVVSPIARRSYRNSTIGPRPPLPKCPLAWPSASVLCPVPLEGTTIACRASNDR
jgi:hypothetical protein